ncbi:RNA-directed DNA polymerase from mobile element jockey [Trichonephila clavipes]|nr:RNA-directed DNA polymerase from mobile element jockey [Trichonephila clavipes]
MFLVQETWLEPGIDPQIENYRLTKDDRIEIPHTVTRGGTAFIKKPLPTVELTSNENIELAFSQLNQNFSEVLVEASKAKFNNASKILSPEIKYKIYQRNRLRKFWQRTRCPSIYSEFQTLSREIAKDIKAHSRDQWEKHIEALLPVDNTLWRKSSLPRKPFQPIPSLKGALGSIAITPIEKAEVIADSLQEQFEPNHVVGRELFDQHIHDEVTDFINIPHVQEIEPTTPTEILSYVQRLKPRKSSGLDQISNRSVYGCIICKRVKFGECIVRDVVNLQIEEQRSKETPLGNSAADIFSV